MGLIGCGGDGVCGDAAPGVDPFPWLKPPAPAPVPTGGAVAPPRCAPRITRRVLIDVAAVLVALWLLSEVA